MTAPTRSPLSVAEAEALGAGPAEAITERIVAATTEADLDELRLAVCCHRQCGALARQFAARRSQLRLAAVRVARDTVPAASS